MGFHPRKGNACSHEFAPIEHPFRLCTGDEAARYLLLSMGHARVAWSLLAQTPFEMEMEMEMKAQPPFEDTGVHRGKIEPSVYMVHYNSCL
jgi:hypothetical protein